MYVRVCNVGESGFNFFRGQGARPRILVLHECTWNAPEVLLVLPAFDVAGCVGFPPLG